MLPGRIASALASKRHTLSVPHQPELPLQEKATYSNDELEEYRQIFSVFDTKGSGSIGMMELKQSMIRLGLNVNDKELENILKEVDQDGNGEIDFSEFCSVMHRMVKKKVTWDEIIKQCFEVFDQHRSGVITEADFRTVLKNIGEMNDDELLDQIFQEVDVDGNGVIDYHEFASMVRNYLKDDDVESLNR